MFARMKLRGLHRDSVGYPDFVKEIIFWQIRAVVAVASLTQTWRFSQRLVPQPTGGGRAVDGLNNMMPGHAHGR